MSKKNYYIECHGPNENGLKSGLNQAIQLCLSQNLSKILFAVGTKMNLQNTLIRNAFGENILNALDKIGSIKVVAGEKNIELVLFTEKKSPAYWDSLILAIHLSPKILDKLGDYSNHKGIVLVPWDKDEYEQWIKRTDAIKVPL